MGCPPERYLYENILHITSDYKYNYDKSRVPWLLVSSWEGFWEEVGKEVGDVGIGAWGRGGQGGEGDWEKYQENKDKRVKKQLEEDGKLEYLLKSAFIFSNVRKEQSFQAGLTTWWLGTDLQTELQQEDAALCSGKNSQGRGCWACHLARLPGGLRTAWRRVS